MDKPNTLLWKLRAIFIALFIPAMLIFIYWAPWLASKPIEQITQYSLSNTPPPPGVRAFSINHGNAIYYEHGTVSEEPIWFSLLTLILLFLWAVLVWLYFKMRKITHDKNT